MSDGEFRRSVGCVKPLFRSTCEVTLSVTRDGNFRQFHRKFHWPDCCSASPGKRGGCSMRVTLVVVLALGVGLFAPRPAGARSCSDNPNVPGYMLGLLRTIGPHWNPQPDEETDV